MLKSLVPAATAGLLIASTSAQTQGPDILIPTGSNDGAYALQDANKNEKYDVPGTECWDHLLYDRNTSPKWYVPLNGRYYFCDTILDQIVSIKDTNSNGLIESSERTTFFDYALTYGGNQGPRMLALDPQGWLWCTNTTGADEGIFKHKDLNNDGDADDTGETIPVLTERMPKVGIANTPNSTTGTPPNLPDFTVTGVDYIMHDPTFKNSRYIVEDEGTDQTLALEDKNNDGDFNDTGECYLFCALYNGGALRSDLNPDVTSGVLPSANEIRGVVVDLNKRYYLMSSDTTAANTDAAIVFRGIDGNGDGDINDKGETTIFWDGSNDSTGATKGYNFINGMSIDLAGRLYLTVEWNSSPDHERLIRVQDKNNDGDANDSGETEVLWDLPVDRTLYRPTILPANSLSPVSGKTTLAEIAYYGSASCRTSLNATSTHNIQYGYADIGNGGSGKPPVIGNSRWLVRTWGAKASTVGGYAIGINKIAAGVPLDAGGTCRVYQSVDILGLGFTTDTTGAHNTIIPIPNNSSLLGLWTYWQSFVNDTTAPAGVGITVSDGMEVKVGDYSYTK